MIDVKARTQVLSQAKTEYATGALCALFCRGAPTLQSGQATFGYPDFGHCAFGLAPSWWRLLSLSASIPTRAAIFVPMSRWAWRERIHTLQIPLHETER